MSYPFEYRGYTRPRLSRSTCTLGLLVAFIACLYCLQADVTRAQALDGAADPQTIRRYWPIEAPTRHWELHQLRNGEPVAPMSLSLSNETLSGDRFIIWFTTAKPIGTATTNGEEYRYCPAKDRGWIFLDSYLSGEGDHWIERPVLSSRIQLTMENHNTEDLMSNGTYADCGAKGQPYLFASQSMIAYRLQVWGYLKKNPKFQWYWDAYVNYSKHVADDCLRPPRSLAAMMVQEAWWSNFANINRVSNNRGWTSGGGGNMGPDGVPDGTGIHYFRTVWHAEGQIPYYLTGTPDGAKIRKCVTEIP